MWKDGRRPVTVDRTCAHQPVITARGAALACHHLQRSSTYDDRHPVVLRTRTQGPGPGRRQERLARRDGAEPDLRRASRCPTASPRPPTPTAASSADSGLAEQIADRLIGLDTDDVTALAAAGQEIRTPSSSSRSRRTSRRDIRDAYAAAGGQARRPEDLSFAVRSSATAEDLPDASFAGQQETFLNVRGIDAILHAIKEVFASLYNDRAIAYRVHHEFEHDDGGAVGRACSGWCAPTSAPPASCSPWTPSPASTTPCSSPPPTGWARPSSRARSTPTSSTSTSRRCGPAAPRSSSAGWASKAHQDGLHRPTPTVGRTTEFVDVDAAERRPLQPHRRRGRASWPGTRSPSRSTTAGRWTSSGARTGSTAASTSCRPARRPCSRAGRPAACSASGSTRAGRCWSRAGRSARRSAPARSGC